VQQIELTALVHLKLCKSLRHITPYTGVVAGAPHRGAQSVSTSFFLKLSLAMRSPTETKSAPKVELAFRFVSHRAKPRNGKLKNRDIYGRQNSSEQAVSESNLDAVFLCQKTAVSSSFALPVSHRIVFSPS
jgi:hypothetical protein